MAMPGRRMSEADNPLLRALPGQDAVRTLAHGRAAADPIERAMTSTPEMMRLMHEGGFRHVPVVDDGVVVGVVSWGSIRISEHGRLDTETHSGERT